MNVAATAWFVDRTCPDDSGNGKSVAAANRTIQAAVSAASAGDVVTVLPDRWRLNSPTRQARTTRAAQCCPASPPISARC